MAQKEQAEVVEALVGLEQRQHRQQVVMEAIRQSRVPRKGIV